MRRIGQEGGQAVLHRRVHGEHVELVHLSELAHQRGRRGHVADLPARDVERLAEARHDQRSLGELGQAREARVRDAVVDHVLVDLVGQHQRLRRPQQLGEARALLARPHGAARVVRRVDDDHARARRQRARERVEVGTPGAGRQRHAHRRRAGERDRRAIAVVARLEYDHLVARMHQREDGRQDALGCAGGDRDLGVGVVAVARRALDLGRDGLAQRRHAGHRRVLVVAGAHRVGDGVDERRVAVEIREALAEVDRAGLDGQRGHHREDRRAHGGKPGAAGEQVLCVREARVRAHSFLHRPRHRGRAATAAASVDRTAARQRSARSRAGRRRAGTRRA